MSRKYKVGDVVWWRGQRRIIQRITPTKHGGHCYYGLRMVKAVAHGLPVMYTNVGFDGRADKTRIYWVRSDRLDAFDGAADRTGSAGRPELMAYKGRKKTRQENRCPFCGQPKQKESRSCNSPDCQWRTIPSRVCACGQRKDRRSKLCRSCHQATVELSPQTLEIVEALKRDQSYGCFTRVANRFGLSRARVSAIARDHLTPRTAPPAVRRDRR